MKPYFFASIAAGLMLGFLATPASAIIIDVTVSGTISSVDNISGDLLSGINVGDTFIAKYTLDLDKAFLTSDAIAAGGGFYGHQPFGSVDLQLGSQHFLIDGNWRGIIENEGSTLSQSIWQKDVLTGLNTILTTNEGFGSFPANIKLPVFDDTLDPAFSLGNLDIHDDKFAIYSKVSATLDSVSSSPAAAPEPASVSLLTTGLFFLGTKRFRKKTANG